MKYVILMLLAFFSSHSPCQATSNNAIFAANDSLIVDKNLKEAARIAMVADSLIDKKRDDIHDAALVQAESIICSVFRATLLKSSAKKASAQKLPAAKFLALLQELFNLQDMAIFRPPKMGKIRGRIVAKGSKVYGKDGKSKLGFGGKKGSYVVEISTSIPYKKKSVTVMDTISSKERWWSSASWQNIFFRFECANHYMDDLPGNPKARGLQVIGLAEEIILSIRRLEKYKRKVLDIELTAAKVYALQTKLRKSTKDFKRNTRSEKMSNRQLAEHSIFFENATRKVKLIDERKINPKINEQDIDAILTIFARQFPPTIDP